MHSIFLNVFKRARTRETHSLPEVIGLQSLRDWTDPAVAFKHHRLKFRQNPAILSQRVPNFLPTVPEDPCTGNPPAYRLHPDGSCEIRIDFLAIDPVKESYNIDPRLKKRMEWILPAPK